MGELNNLLKYSLKLNVLKVHSQNTYEHEKTKFDIAFLLRKNKLDFASEVEFKSGGRADIVDFSNMVVYEVLQSESIYDFESKKSFYPSCLTILPVKAGVDLVSLKKFLGVD